MAVYRNANILLIFLFLLTLIFIAGTFVFFQKSYERIYEKYSSKSDNLKQIEADLSTKYKSLQVAEKDIRTKLQSEQVTAENYKQVLGVKQTLEDEIKSLEGSIKTLNQEYTAQQSQTADQEAKAALSQARGGQLRSEVGQYDEDLRKLNILTGVITEEIEATKKRIQSA